MFVNFGRQYSDTPSSKCKDNFPPHPSCVATLPRTTLASKHARCFPLCGWLRKDDASYRWLTNFSISWNFKLQIDTSVTDLGLADWRWVCTSVESLPPFQAKLVHSLLLTDYLCLMQELGELLGLEPVSLMIKKSRLRWFGRVERKDDNDWVKRCITWEVEGIWQTGRPKKEQVRLC